MLVSSLSQKKGKNTRQNERERARVRERGVGALSSDREGGRVLRGGVEPERKSFEEEDFAHYQKNIIS